MNRDKLVADLNEIIEKYGSVEEYYRKMYVPPKPLYDLSFELPMNASKESVTDFIKFLSNHLSDDGAGELKCKEIDEGETSWSGNHFKYITGHFFYYKTETEPDKENKFQGKKRMIQ